MRETKLFLLLALAIIASTAKAWDGAGTTADPYQIRNSADWATLAEEVGAGNVADGTAFLLMGDISVKTPVGTSDHHFKGSFDGGGHTITASLSAESGPIAPFAYAEGAAISHLHVSGTIHGGLHTAGLVSSLSGTGNTISDCHVSATITTFAENSMIVAGGLIGHAGTSTLTMDGCLFDGSITATGGVSFSYAGAFVGWATKEGMSITVKNSMENGSYTGINHAGFNYADDRSASTVSTSNCYTLSHHWGEVKHGYKIIYFSDTYPPQPVITDTYRTTGIEALEQGLKLGDTFYLGPDDKIRFPSYELEGGTIFKGYCFSATDDHVTMIQGDDELTMPAEDVYMSLYQDLKGEGSEDNPYLIENSGDWLFFTYTFGSIGTRGKHFRLTNDIDIYTRAGYAQSGVDDLCFTGVFDGGGHTITTHLSGGNYMAPFYKLNGGSIKNLHVTGDISGGLHTAGLVGGIVGNANLIENCRVSATITVPGNLQSPTHAGGLVGHATSSTTTLRGCLFDGKIFGEELTHIGFLVGWCSHSDGITLQDCANNSSRFLGSNGFKSDLVLDESAGGTGRCGTAINTYGGFRVGQITKVLSSGHPALKLTYGLAGGLTAPVEYSTSHLASYGTGLLLGDDLFFVGDNDQPRFRITVDEGLAFSHVTATGATITGPTDGWYTLTFANSPTSTDSPTISTTISATLASTGDFEGDGTEASPYLISRSPDWVKLSIDVAGGNSYAGKVLRLTKDIDCEGVTVGTDGHYFSGTFDGDGHTLTLNVANEYNPSPTATAPFFRVSEATFRHLHTAGKVYTSDKYTAGIISQVFGTKATRLYDCHSSMTVYAAIDGDASNGGLVGAVSNCNSLVIDRCTFTGNLHGRFHAATNCGGFVGWSNVPVTIRQSLFDPDDLSFGRVVSSGQNFARMSDYSQLKLEECYTTYNFEVDNNLMVLQGFQGTFVVDELFAPQGGSYEFVGDPDVSFNGRGYYKNGCWIRTTLDASVPFDHWQDGTSGGCFISDPWTRNGLHQLNDMDHKPSLGVWTNAIPEAETERTLWGVKYRYLSRRDYHFFISDEERMAKGWTFESDDSDANMIVKDSNGKASEITAVVGYDEDDFNEDGVQIHNDLVGDWRAHTHLGLIAPHAFRGSTSLKTLYFKDTDANNYNSLLPFDFFIDWGAFEGCTNFKELKLMQYTTEGSNHWTALEPTQVYRVADDAFSGCPNLKISVQADKYQDFVSSPVWKQHRQRFIVYEATTEDFTVDGVKYHWYRNFDQTEDLKNDDSGKTKMLEQIRIWNADYQQFSAASLLDTKDDCNVYYASVVGVDDDDIDNNGGTMKIYNDPGSYYNYKTILLNRDAIAGNTHVKNIEFWQTNGRSENSYSDLKMVIPNGAFAGCTNLKELRLFYYWQDGEDRWMALGPKDVIPGDNIFGEPSAAELATMTPEQIANRNRTTKDFRILVSTELYPDFMDDPNWQSYIAYLEPVDYSPETPMAFTSDGLTYDYMLSPGGIKQTSQVVSQDVSWWTAPRIAIEAAMMLVSFTVTPGSNFTNSSTSAAIASIQEAETLRATAVAALADVSEGIANDEFTNVMVFSMRDLFQSQIGGRVFNGISAEARNYLIQRGFISPTGEWLAKGIQVLLDEVMAKGEIATFAKYLEETMKMGVRKAVELILERQAGNKAAETTFRMISYLHASAIKRAFSIATNAAAITCPTSLLASKCWGGSGSYNAELLNKGMRENILSNIHQVGLVGGGYVITTPQKNLVYHTYIKTVADNVQNAVIKAGSWTGTNQSTATITFAPKAFRNKASLQTVRFEESPCTSNASTTLPFVIPDSAFVGCTALTEFSTLLQTDDNGTRALGPENFVLAGDSIFAGLKCKAEVDSLTKIGQGNGLVPFYIIIDPQRKDDFLASASWKPLEKYFKYESALPAAQYSEYGAKYAYAYEQNTIKKEHKVNGHLIEHTLVVGPDDDFITNHQGAVKLCNDIGTYNNYQLDEVMAEAFKNNTNLRSVSFVDLYGFGAFGDCYTDLRVHIGDRAFQGCSNLADLDLLYMVTDGTNHIEPMTPQMISIGKDVFKDSPARIKMMPQQVAWFEADEAWAEYKDRFMPCVIRISDPTLKKIFKEWTYYDPANTGTDPAYWDDYIDLARLAGVGFSWLDGRFKEQRDFIDSFSEFKYFESVGLDYIGDWFRECRFLSNIELPSTIKRIGEYAFMFCTKLKEIVLPPSVTYIDHCAFDLCSNLNTIVVKGEVPATLGSSVFYEHDGLKIYVPAHKVAAYKEAWSEYAQYIVGDDTYHVNKVITVDAPGQLASKLDLTLEKENDKVRYIRGHYTKYDSLTVRGPLNGEDVAVLRHLMGANAWESEFTDGKLRYLNLWDADLKKDLYNSYNGYGVDEYLDQDNWVGEYMFHNCNSIESIVLPKTVTEIGENAFQEAYGLKRIAVGRNTTKYTRDLLQELNGLEELVFLTNSPATSENSDPWEAPISQVYTLPSQIGDYLGDVNLINRAQDISSPFSSDDIMWTLADKGHFFPSSYLLMENVENIFNGNTTIKDMDEFQLFQNVKRLDNTFSGMSQLETIALPDRIESISASAFSGCTSLQTIHVSSVRVETVEDSVGSQSTKDSLRYIVPTLAQNAFKDLPDDFQILVPKEYCKLYRERWAQYADHINPDNSYYATDEIITVTVTEPNTLAQKLGLTITTEWATGFGGNYVKSIKGDYSSVHKLKVIGPISGADFDVLRYLAGYCPWAMTRNYSGHLEYIDLYDAQIKASDIGVVGYERSGSSFFMAENFQLNHVRDNNLPRHALLRAYSLQTLILPRTCTKVETRALQECEGLESLVIGDDCIDFNWNALDDNAMLTRLYILTPKKLKISTEDFIWRNLCNNYNPTFDAFYVRPSLYQQYIEDDAYVGSSWQRTNNVSKGDFNDDESFCVFASHAAATFDDLVQVRSVKGWFDNHTGVRDLTALGFAAIDSLRAEDMQKLKQLEKVTLPVTLEVIGDNAFSQASNLRYVNMFMVNDTLTAKVKRYGLRSLGIDSLQTLVYLPQTYGEAKGTNIVVYDGTEFAAQRFRLVDDKDYCVPFAFTTTEVENSRAMTAADTPYTVCLPYELDVPEHARAFELSEREGSTLVFYEIVSGQKMEALMPYLLKVDGNKRLRKDSITLNTTISQTIPASSGTYGRQIDKVGYSLRGTLVGISNAEAAEQGAYILQSDGDWHPVSTANTKASVLPFRAYLLSSSRLARKARISMSLEDKDIDSFKTIDLDGTCHYYDLNGRELPGKPAQGVYIYNGKKRISK